MTYKFHTRLDLINGGNIFRQDDKITLGYIARNANGEPIDFSGKEIMGTIYNRRAGIMYEAAASFDADSQKIIFTITQTLDHGTFEIEFVVTDSSDTNYRVVVPSDEYSGRLDIKPSSANIEVTGVRMVTVEQLRSEQQLAQSNYEEKVDGKVQQLETGFTNHKNAVDLVVEDVQQKASAAETATQTANDAASVATSAASSANTAASSANAQAGAAQQAASAATTASTAANSSADRANTAAENAEGIVDEFGAYKDSATKAKTFGTVDARFEELENDSFFPVKNDSPYGTQEKSLNTNSADGKIDITGNNGDKIYVSFLIKIPSSETLLTYYRFQEAVVSLTSSIAERNIFTRWSGMGIFDNSLSRLYVGWYQTSVDIGSIIKERLLVNLTKTFGSGSEPTKEEMDTLLAFYPSSWFDGTVNLAENKKLVTFLLNQLRGKATKKQESWITPTLLSGWVQDGAFNIGFYKDDMGIVRLKGRIKSGTMGSDISVLPAGYRPSQLLNFPVICGGGSLGFLQVSSTGAIKLLTGNNVYVTLDNIAFKND